VRYLALLRGINAGGKNIVEMRDLRSCFDRLGLQNATTYIQSGNVLFDCSVKSAGSLPALIEAAVAAEFHCASAVVIVPQKQLARIVGHAPASFGSDFATTGSRTGSPADYRSETGSRRSL
jgi:uncharacterized protein (DUF1697 family)